MTTGRRILCLYHASQRDDRVSRMLRQRGHALTWINPARGEALPDRLDDYHAMVVYGGEQSVNDDTPAMHRERDFIGRWVAREKPYLGLCLGGQLLADALGAPIRRHPEGLLESGYTLVRPDGNGAGLLERPMYVFQWHNEGFELPAGCQRLASGSRYPNQAFAWRGHLIGLQFHPEVTPGIMLAWFREGGHLLTRAGGQCAAAQLRDAPVFEPVIERWTQTLLDHWLAHASCAESAEVH